MKKRKFKIGDTVRIIKNNSGNKFYDKYIGKCATIVMMDLYNAVLNISSEYQGYSTDWEFDEIEKIDEIQKKLE